MELVRLWPAPGDVDQKKASVDSIHVSIRSNTMSDPSARGAQRSTRPKSEARPAAQNSAAREARCLLELQTRACPRSF